MVAMEKILFLKTYSDYHTNGANRSYWAKFFKLISEELQDTKIMRLYGSFNENMPIYEYYSTVKCKYVRIMQYNPENEMIKSETYSTNRFYTAWIDKRSATVESMAEPELVVCLLMTRTNIINAETLIRSWLFDRDERTYALIQRIYEEQERLDDEGKI